MSMAVDKPLAVKSNVMETLAAFYHRWGSALVVVAIIAVWQLVAMTLRVPIYILPQPTDLIGGLPRTANTLFTGWGVTMVEALIGFVIGNAFSIAVAFLVTWSSTARAGIMPVALAVKSVPMVAITPLITLAVGFGHATVVTIAAVVCFFPTLVNVSRGLRAAPRGTVEVLYLLDANPWQFFWKLRLPYALPFLFTALRITAPAAIGGTMLAEYVASNAGLGYLIQDGYGRFQFVLVWQIVVLATITTLCAYLAVAWCEARALANRR
jgi:NitT/TauT family transport system permease protein